MEHEAREERRQDGLAGTFDAVADQYDRVRPGYPQVLLDALVALTGIGPGSRVLEIAPGTGQLSVPLARLGVALTAVEMGGRLAALAGRNLAPYPAATVVRSTFEAWQPPAEPFDLVACATAWHWLDPAVRVRKSLDVLRPGGSLAVLSTEHVEGGTSAFFAEVQDCYERWDPATRPGLRPPQADDVPHHAADEDAPDPRVVGRHVRRVTWDATYSAGAYRELIGTYSPTLALDPDRRAGLLDCVGGLLERRYGGTVVKRYLTELQLLTRG